MWYTELSYTNHASSTWRSTPIWLELQPFDLSWKSKSKMLFQPGIQIMFTLNTCNVSRCHLHHIEVQHEGVLRFGCKFHQSIDRAFLGRYTSFPASLVLWIIFCTLETRFSTRYQFEVVMSSTWRTTPIWLQISPIDRSWKSMPKPMFQPGNQVILNIGICNVETLNVQNIEVQHEGMLRFGCIFF